MALPCDNSGAHSSMAPFSIAMLSLLALSAASPESDALLKMKASLKNVGALATWTGNTTPCTGNNPNWLGLRCLKGSVWILQLESMGLSGTIDVSALASLPSLRSLSFQDNNFSGAIPDLSKQGALKAIFLSKNQFSGEIPAGAFSSMSSLKKVYLADNRFSGKIPASLTALPRLLQLDLEKNEFSGEIPDFKQKGLEKVDFSYNQLTGRIPSGLKKMNRSSFIGNKDLCGEPLETQCMASNSSSPSILLIALIVITVGLVLAAAAAIFVFLRRKRSTEAMESSQHSSNKHKKVASYDDSRSDSGSPEKFSGSNRREGKEDHEQAGLVFICREDRERFELQDLLGASAQVLGSGDFGSSYKAVLLSGSALVVKRFKVMNSVGRNDFQAHMRRLGRLRHPNLLPVLAFYYRKEEKLLVTDYLPNGSLAHLLHGNKSPNRPILDWPTRLRIVKGVARGLAYLHNEFQDLILPHGHLKSSNILLNNSFEPLLTDYTLAPLVNLEDATQLMIGYKSLEYVQFSQLTKKSDVWSLGVLILEILTGKFPSSYLQDGNGGTDLANWVNSVVRKEWTGEVLDRQMGATKNCVGEMLRLLQIGMGCCEADVEKRWELNEAVMRIEELRESGSEEEEFSFVSEGEYSSRGEATEEFSFSMT